MSAVVTQLSFNINEKLRIDDRSFSPFQQHHKNENSVGQGNKPSTSFSYTPKEPSGQWATSPPSPGGNPLAAANAASSVASAASTSANSASCVQTKPTEQNAAFVGSSGAVVGLSCQKLTPQRPGVLTRRDLRSSNALTKSKYADATHVTVLDLHEQSRKVTRSTLSAVHTSSRGKTTSKTPIDADNPFQFTASTSKGFAKSDSAFPSVVGKSCTLHSPRKGAGPFQTPQATGGSDIPPIKKHCRSVSEPDETMSAIDPLETAGMPTFWKPKCKSKVWVPVRQSIGGARRVQSAYSTSSSTGDCSRSLDCSSAASMTGDSLLTPPASPVPRPASVTVIKQESGSWAFLSSHQHHLCGGGGGHYQQHAGGGFSPLSSPYCGAASPSSSRSNEAGARSWSHSGLSATKRSLSFSDDFGHRESIHYTPSSTPDLERRFERGSSRHGGLLRCQSHPSDLNARRTRTRRRSHNRLCYQRPTLDFAKMKQTSMSKRNKCSKERNNSGSQYFSSGDWPTPASRNKNTTTSGTTGSGDLGPVAGKLAEVDPVFPSTVGAHCRPEADRSVAECSMEPHTPPSTSPYMFTIGPGSQAMSHIRDVRERIPSPTDEVPGEADMDDGAGELATAPGGVSAGFALDCADLDVDLIENESECEL